MKYSIEEMGFILYNNRSVKNVVMNFITDEDPLKVFLIEKRLKISKSIFMDDKKMVEIKTSELDTTPDDIIVKPDDINSLTEMFKNSVGDLSFNEFDYLRSRGIDESMIKSMCLVGVSSINDDRISEIIGLKIHPILENILSSGNEGIIIPLYENGLLTNCSIRRIDYSGSTKKSLKYSLACPDIPVWGLDGIKNEEIWLTEGIFDMAAINSLGHKCISCSSAMWGGLQLYKVLENKPSKINIFSDNDEVGIRTSGILQHFFISYGIDCVVYLSEYSDASEHILINNMGLDSLREIVVTDELINEKLDDSFDFIKHLKSRNIN